MGSAPAAVAFPTSADVAIARALLFLADSSTAPPLPILSDEPSSYSASSSSYSVTSARSCVSDSARRGRRGVDPLRVLAVVASLRRIDPKVLAKATSKLYHGEAGKKRKGVWIQVSDDEEDESERASTVASEGSAITGAASAGSTATSGRYSRPARASGGGAGGHLMERAEAIMGWLSRPKAVPASETAIRAAVGDSAKTSKALRWLLKQKRGLRRTGTGGRPDPYLYMVAG